MTIVTLERYSDILQEYMESIELSYRDVSDVLRHRGDGAVRTREFGIISRKTDNLRDLTTWRERINQLKDREEDITQQELEDLYMSGKEIELSMIDLKQDVFKLIIHMG